MLPLRTASGSTQPKVPMSLCTQAGRGATIVSPSSNPLGAAVPGPDFNKTLPACSTAASSSSQPAAVTSAQTATGQQPKVPLHVGSQMTVNQARNAVRTGKVHKCCRTAWKRTSRSFYFCGLCSCLSQSGQTHGSGDSHPVGDFPPTRRHQSRSRLQPVRGGDGLRCCFSDPTQCERCVFGQWGFETRTCREQLCPQSLIERSSGRQTGQGCQGRTFLNGKDLVSKNQTKYPTFKHFLISSQMRADITFSLNALVNI